MALDYETTRSTSAIHFLEPEPAQTDSRILGLSDVCGFSASRLLGCPDGSRVPLPSALCAHEYPGLGTPAVASTGAAASAWQRKEWRCVLVAVDPSAKAETCRGSTDTP